MPSDRTQRPAQAGIVLAAVLALAGCGGTGSKTEATSAASSPMSAASSPGAQPGSVAGPDGSTFTTKQGAAGLEVLAQFEIDAGAPDSIMRTKAQLTTMDILNDVKQKFPDAAEVVIKGEVGDAVLVTLNYSKATLSSIEDFKRVPKGEIWELADSGYIDPAFPM